MPATDPASSPSLRNASESAPFGGPLPVFLPAAAAGVLLDALWAPPIVFWGGLFLFAFFRVIKSLNYKVRKRNEFCKNNSKYIVNKMLVRQG